MGQINETAEHLLRQGELCLLKKDLLGIEFFNQSLELDPQNPHLFFKQALALYEFGEAESQEPCLLMASKKLKTASRLAPNDFPIWNLWGKVLSALGKISQRNHFFLEAKEKLKKAISLSASEDKEILASLYWNYAITWKKSADLSEEALDYQLAVQAFETAATHSDSLPIAFWTEYGKTCLDLADNINDIRLCIKAINNLKQGVSLSKTSYDGWMLLAKALEKLYDHTHDEDHFSQANECFAAAAQLDTQKEITLWLHWAQFLCDTGRAHQDIKKLRSCIEKCHRAQAIDANNPLVMSIWAEALALIGELSDRVDLIYEAQNKIALAAEGLENHPDIWFSYGMCLNSFAQYFEEIDYNYQAIEKFQQGLSINRTQHRHWHAIANTYSLIGESEEDPDSLELSCRFYAKAIDLHPSSTYIYNYAFALSKLGEITQEQRWLEESIVQFERALSRQKNAAYLHPEWLFYYANALDLLGEYYEEKSYYTRAIEILSHVLMIDPDFPSIHHQIALTYSHLAGLIEEKEHYTRAIFHYRLSLKHDEENDQILIDWSTTLMSLAEYAQDPGEANQLYREAEHKLIQAAKLGNIHAFYHMACLYSLMENYEKSLSFIEKADTFQALPPLEDLLEDEWLEGVRSSPDFREMLLKLEKRPHLHEEH